MSAELSSDFITMAAATPAGCSVTEWGTPTSQKCRFPDGGSGAKMSFNMGDVTDLAIFKIAGLFKK